MEKNTHQNQKNTNDHEDCDYQIITFLHSRIPTSSSRNPANSPAMSASCTRRFFPMRRTSLELPVPLVLTTSTWRSCKNTKGHQKLWRFIDIRYPSISFPLVEHSMATALHLQSLMESPALILDFNTKWIALCEQYHRTKAPFVAAMVKAVRAVRDQNVIIDGDKS